MKREERAGAVFAALSDPTRRSVVRALGDGPSTPTELAARMTVSRQAISKHLAALSDAGLVAAERDGRETRYTLTPGPMEDAMAWMTDAGSEWDARLARLKQRFTR